MVIIAGARGLKTQKPGSGGTEPGSAIFVITGAGEDNLNLYRAQCLTGRHGLSSAHANLLIPHVFGRAA